MQCRPMNIAEEGVGFDVFGVVGEDNVAGVL